MSASGSPVISTPPTPQDQSYLKQMLDDFERVEEEKKAGVIQPPPIYPNTILNTPTVQSSNAEHIQPEIVPIDGMCAISILGQLLLSPKESRIGIFEGGLLAIQSSKLNVLSASRIFADAINSAAALVVNGAARYAGNQNGDQLACLSNPIKETFKIYNVRNNHITIKFQAAIGGLLILEELYKDRTVLLPSLIKMKIAIRDHLLSNNIDPFPTPIITYLYRYHAIFLANPLSPSITPRHTSSPITIPQRYNNQNLGYGSQEYPVLTPISTCDPNIYIYDPENNYRWGVSELLTSSNTLAHILTNYLDPQSPEVTEICSHLQKIITNHGEIHSSNLALTKLLNISPYASRI